ncbi:MAG TPA: 2-hydroxyglutaryl-CoA dehydratase [Firmicutes bacterium]|nr:2-hydroxyglutaryl-CoA dehydratase [Bacillota bacterium]
MLRTRLGIPRALFFYSYLPFWHTFWSSLGFEVIVSPRTNKEILDLGVEQASTDLCVPVKLFHGHVAYLAPRVDLLFLPRMVNVGSGATFCPKFLALPEMVKYSLAGLPHLVEARIDVAKPWDLFTLCRELHKEWAPSGNPWVAYQRAQAAQRAFEAGLARRERVGALLAPYTEDFGESQRRVDSQGEGEEKEGVQVAVLGYPYAVHDAFLNGDVLWKLVRLGVKVYTADMVSWHERRRYRMHKDLFWHYSNLVLQAGKYWLDPRRRIDGLIHVTNFACGPDAMVGKFLEFEAKAREVPLLQLTLDEQTGQVGLDTRIEAFVDMLTRRKTRAHNLSLHG